MQPQKYYSGEIQSMPSTKKGFVIREKEPTGDTSVAALQGFVSDVNKRAADLRPVWDAITPDMKQALKFEFSAANPNSWAGLEQKYVRWKRKQGYPDTIGIATGALKSSLTDTPKIRKRKKSMRWRPDGNVEGRDGRKVKTYMGFFNRKRPIFGHTVKFIARTVRKAVFKHVIKRTTFK